MQSLINGADCSTSSNPLNQVLKREGVDNSLFRDRLTPGGSSSSQLPFRPILSGPNISHSQHSKSTLQNNITPHPFNLSHLSSALAASRSQSPAQQNFSVQQPAIANQNLNSEWERLRHQTPQHQPQRLIQNHQPSAFSSEFVHNQNGHPAWAESFQSQGKGKGRAMVQHAPSPIPQQTYTGNPYMSQLQPFQSRLQPMYSQLPYHQDQMVNGGRVERDAVQQKEMEDAFERALKDAQEQTAAERIKDDHEEEIEEIVREPKGDLEAVWESLRPEAERLGKLAEWENDFSQFTSGEDDTFDILNESLNRDDVGQTGLEEQLHIDGQTPQSFPSENEGRSQRPYEFASPNPFFKSAPTDAWIEANRTLSSGGSLSIVSNLLESFITNAKPRDLEFLQVTRIDAWSLLGRTQAMNEKEEKAMSAFEQGVAELKSVGAVGEKSAGEMLTNLAISYVNESLDLEALSTLHQFLQILHPTYAGPSPSQSQLSETTSPWSLHQGMTDSFLNLAREQYTRNGQVDPDVQVGLGTLYYMMGDYGEARGCWVAALGERPDDYLLWNRLGATLANGGDPEEAVDAYRRALELKPTFTRAIFNLGVACLNIGVYREAAEHFLAALSLHPKSSGSDTNGKSENPQIEGNDSTTLWSTLRRSLVALDLPALANIAHPGTDLEIYRRAGFDF